MNLGGTSVGDGGYTSVDGEDDRSYTSVDDEDGTDDEGDDDAGNNENVNRVENADEMEGLVFESEKELRTYFNSYAESKGFGVVKMSGKKDDGGRQRWFTLACSRRGKHKSSSQNSFKSRSSSRTGCRAEINVVVDFDGKCRISRDSEEHNHDLSPNKSRYHRCHRRMDSMTQMMLVANDQAGIRVSKSYSAAAIVAGGFDQLNFDERYCRTLITKLRESKLGPGDSEAVCAYFNRMRRRNPNFYHIVELDSLGRLKNLFWADARSRAAYESFNDVISFDSTYMTNKYSMPFAPFVGVNHHGHSILLGCGLLSSENTEGYCWLFRCWLECMNNIAPAAIITDQCLAIRAAIIQVFPNAVHRLCVWHIMKKIPMKFQDRASYKNVSFHLKEVVYESVTVKEFEDGWTRMLEEFGLSGVVWLRDLYEIRDRWVPVFVKDWFWAGMSSTQRSESMNSFFDKYVHSETLLKVFLVQYDEALKSKVEKENKTDFDSLRACALLTHHGYERKFAYAYTTEIFRLFQDEIRGLIHCNVTYDGSDGGIARYKVVDATPGCLSLGGFVCRHIIKVLIDKEIDELPDWYILDRWKKGKRGYNYVNNCYDDPETRDEQVRTSRLYMEFSRVIEMTNRSFDQFEFANHAIRVLVDILEKNEVAAEEAQRLNEGRVLTPVKVRGRGRPPSKRKECLAFGGGDRRTCVRKVMFGNGADGASSSNC